MIAADRTENYERSKFVTYTVDELMKMDFPVPTAIVLGLLVEGVSLLAAPSKMGKSWLALNLALAVAAGKPFLGYDTIQSGVLYFALEDSPYRLAERIKSIIGDAPSPPDLKLVTQCGIIDDDFFTKLTYEIQESNNLRLVIIDTLQKIKPISKGRNEYEENYSFLSKISNYAQENHLAILFIHHTRKSSAQGGSDAYMDILGSTALQAATDSMYVMQGDRNKRKNVKFFATGRDIYDLELILDFDNEQCMWVNLGEQSDLENRRYKSDPIVKTVVAKLKEIENDPVAKKKEFATTIKNLQELVQEYTGERITDKPRQFSSYLKKLDSYFESIGINHTSDTKTTTIDSVPGLYHRFRYIS